jgi:hypothetical protein
MIVEKEEEKENLEEMQVSSEPCKPTTSICGRPTHFVRRKRPEDIRSAVVPVRFTETERDKILGYAEARRLSLSDFIRTAALSKKLSRPGATAIDRGIYQELARIGNNLNQLVRSVNSRIVHCVERQLLVELQTIVRQLGLSLIQSTR